MSRCEKRRGCASSGSQHAFTEPKAGFHSHTILGIEHLPPHPLVARRARTFVAALTPRSRVQVDEVEDPQILPIPCSSEADKLVSIGANEWFPEVSESGWKSVCPVGCIYGGIKQRPLNEVQDEGYPRRAPIIPSIVVGPFAGSAVDSRVASDKHLRPRGTNHSVLRRCHGPGMAPSL